MNNSIIQRKYEGWIGGWMDGKQTSREGVGEATGSHNLHSGGAGKWFLVSGPQLSRPAVKEK